MAKYLDKILDAGDGRLSERVYYLEISSDKVPFRRLRNFYYNYFDGSYDLSRIFYKRKNLLSKYSLSEEEIKIRGEGRKIPIVQV